MRDHRPPERISPVKFASLQASFSGVLPVTHFARLTEFLASQEGEVHCELEGAVDEAKLPLLKARVKANLSLLCQTCLTPMQFPVDHRFTLGVVEDDEAAEKLTEYEPLICRGEDVLVSDIFEDELILSLPVVANHEPEECAVNMTTLRQDDEIEVNEKPNPFAVLASLKKPK